MSVEWFLKLKEIDSLTKMKLNLLKAKSEQEERITKLDQRRQENLSLTTTLRQELISANQHLAELESRIKVASEQKQRMLDIGGDEKKIAEYSTEIASMEEKGFDFLNQIEILENQLADNKTFLVGLEKTMAEISQETTTEIKSIVKEIVTLEYRISSLIEEIPAEFKALLIKVMAKKPAHGPFTRVENGSCYFCRYQVSRIDESEIDMQKSLKTCKQCGRIFLPYGG